MYIIIYGQPIPKKRPRVTQRSGKVWTYTPQQSADYARSVKNLARNAAFREHLTAIPKEAPVKLSIKFVVHGKSTSTPDIVNLAAQIADAVEGVFYDNDSQIVELHCFKQHGAKPRAYINVESA